MYTVVKPTMEITPKLFGDFLRFIDVSEKTQQTYLRALNQFMKYLSAMDIKTPQRADLIAYRDMLMENHKASTVACYLQAVRLFFQWAELQGLYPDVSKHIKVKTDRGHKKDALTSSQLKSVISGVDTTTIKGKRDYALLVLMATTGLRAIEVSRANIGDIKTVSDCTCLFIQGKGKTSKSDYVKVPEQTERIIREYLTIRNATDLDEPLFTSTSNRSPGKRLSTRTISGICKDSFKAVGINSDRVTCHSLRHTAVTLALMNGNTLQEASEFARHSSIATTMIYSHNLDKLNNGCSESVADAIL